MRPISGMPVRTGIFQTGRDGNPFTDEAGSDQAGKTDAQDRQCEACRNLMTARPSVIMAKISDIAMPPRSRTGLPSPSSR